MVDYKRKKIVNKRLTGEVLQFGITIFFFPVLFNEVVVLNVLIGGTYYLIKMLLQCFMDVKLSSC